MQYLDFTGSRCRDCYKCLRECPVKAIKFVDHEARIIEDRCILCGKCTVVCPQNAKRVHSEIAEVEALLASGKPVIASVAPSFVSAFGVKDFSAIGIALGKLGFKMAEETAVGANIVTAEYEKLLETGEFKNFITSACPAINRMIQLYYPKALKYLAPVASPMVAHAKLLKKRYPDAEIVFIGPCIAKKREGRESGLISAVLTFNELNTLFTAAGIDLNAIASIQVSEPVKNRSKYYPISRGIIKSFNKLPKNYEYVAVDGVKRSFDVLEDIDKLEGMFIEINCCEYACINGPATIRSEGSLKANEDVRRYAQNSLKDGEPGYIDPMGVELAEGHPRISLGNVVPSERDIRAVLAKTGKLKPEDELNCGACGYPTCREKAIAVLNGNADVEMCIPYMRKRAESMSYEIIQNSPNGIIMMDYDLKISESNTLARKLLGITLDDPKGTYLYESINAADFFQAVAGGKDVHKKKLYIEESKRYVDMNIILLPEHKTLFAVLKDVTNAVEYSKELEEVREKTLETTDEVIKKQMRVAQEIASLLGETTAETKVALLKLKNTLAGEQEE